MYLLLSGSEHCYTYLILDSLLVKERDSAVGIATGYGLDD
jgi:transposase-like protein